jgi:4'-phosphopantetheinyl transferase
LEVWVADLEVPPDELPALAALLDDGERARAERLRFEDLRRRFVASHAMVRLVLRGRVGGDVRFVVGEHGKPALAGEGVHFNLSHAGERALLAISDQPVGVDVERLRALSNLDAMAQRVMSPAELRTYQEAADPTRCFFDLWVRKEAVLKATGEGISRELRALDVATCGLHVVPLDVGEGYAAAVASPHPFDVRSRPLPFRWPSVGEGAQPARQARPADRPPSGDQPGEGTLRRRSGTSS